MSMLFLLLVNAAVTTQPSDQGRLPDALDLGTVRALITQHDGRWPPLDTVAEDAVESVTGKTRFQGRDPVLWLLAWTFEPEYWSKQPLIPIRNAHLREALDLPQDRTLFSCSELARHKRLQELSRQMSSGGGMGPMGKSMGGGKPDPLQSKVRDIEDKLALMGQVFSGQMICLIPDPANATAAWKPIGLAAPHGHAEAEKAEAAWKSLKKAFLADDPKAFAAASDQLQNELDALPGGYRPTPELIATELKYNRLQPFRMAWIILVSGAVLAALAALTRQDWIRIPATLALVVGFAALSYGLWLRWTIAGRIPAANMFESMLFLSWGTGAFAILSMILIRDRIVPLTASFLCALAIFLAENLPLDRFIRPIAPVLLDTAWMSIHVPIMMLSYGVLALAAIIAHAQLVIMAAAPGRQKLVEKVDFFHYWYMLVGCVLLGVGISTGSMWAASSWGRYWGWDPKEVWALVAFLAYIAILHRGIERKQTPPWVYLFGLVLTVTVLCLIAMALHPRGSMAILALMAAAASIPLFSFAHGPLATAVKSVLAFWMIIMTYVGVNFVLGIGLHSYAFGTGAVAHYMFLIGGIDLALMAVCTGVYLLLRNRRPGGLPSVPTRPA